MQRCAAVWLVASCSRLHRRQALDGFLYGSLPDPILMIRFTRFGASLYPHVRDDSHTEVAQFYDGDRFRGLNGHLRDVISIGRWNATAHAYRAPGFLSWSQQPNIAMPKADKMFGSERYHFGRYDQWAAGYDGNVGCASRSGVPRAKTFTRITNE